MSIAENQMSKQAKLSLSTGFLKSPVRGEKEESIQ
jgi:hypothetical protein